MNQLEQTLDSREVAEMVRKEHHKLMRDIRTYIVQLAESKIGFTNFFVESTYRSEQNKELPCYLVTKKGCEFIAHKLTGAKGTEFTARYIDRFHEMEGALKDPRRLSPAEQIKIIATGCVEMEERIEAVGKELQEFKQDMPILGIEESRITAAVRAKGVDCLGGKESAAYQDKSLRGKVYADIYGQLKREFGVSTYKAIKRSQCDDAIHAIDGYRLPSVLQDRIEAYNGQLHLQEETDVWKAR